MDDTNPLLTGNLFAIGRTRPRVDPLVVAAKRYRAATKEEASASAALMRAGPQQLEEAQGRYRKAELEADAAAEFVLQVAAART